MNSLSSIQFTEPYRDRKTEFLGIWENDSWKLKLYAITHHGNSRADENTIAIAGQLVQEALANHSHHARAYGLGYIIIHRGMDCNFIVVSWWAGENMRISRAFMATLHAPDDYHDITATGMTVCVWDEMVHAHERDAWVTLVMTPASPDVAGYLARTLTIN
jgi:hypothetical protein